MKLSRYARNFAILLCCSVDLLTARCESWDYIIVGDGTAGAALAGELTRESNHRVLVLEWGENHTLDPIVLNPDVFAPTLSELIYSPIYASTEIAPINFPNRLTQHFIYSEGRMWGGSSGHNRLFAVRGTPRLYNSWAAITGQPRWDYNHMLPLFLEVEHYTANATIPDPGQRGLAGPLFITQSPPVTSDPFAIGYSAATGIPFQADYNNPAQGGDVCISAHQQWITPLPFSFRSFSANAFTNVGEVVDERGFGINGRQLRIVSNAFVDKVIFKHKKAIGVQYYVDGDINRVLFVEAKKKVILCAGPIRTPGILERSGIGSAALLHSLGIPVVLDNPNVGQHLQNHYGAIGIFEGTTTASPFISIYSDNGFADSIRRLQVTAFSPLGENTTVTSGSLLIPHSRGSVHIVSKNPTIDPLINLNMYSDGPVGTFDTDAYNIVTFLKSLQDVATSTGYTLLSPSPAVYLGGDSALLDYAQTLANMVISYHATGTTRMGFTPANSVVDGNLHVFGVTNLMVADVGIEPEIEDGNTAYAAYFIGLQAALIIKSGL